MNDLHRKPEPSELSKAPLGQSAKQNISAALAERIRAYALAHGATAAAWFDARNIRLYTEVRDMCAADKCRSYGKNWQCPPAVGDLAEWAERLRDYPDGLLLQVTCTLEDDFDIDGMMAGQKTIQNLFQQIVSRFQTERQHFLPLGAGSCSLCSRCTCPDAPCRHPNLAIPSLESVGYLVSDICERAALPYSYGRRTLTYCGAVLFSRPSGVPDKA